MKRREFIITILGGAATYWPLTSHAQQPERIRRIGVLMGYAESGSSGQALLGRTGEQSFRGSLAGLDRIGHCDFARH